jgi:peroxiredoxin
MSIRIGDALPAATTLREIAGGSSTPRTVDELTRNKRVIIIGLPGAFTPTCSGKHIPGFLEYYPKLKAKAVDEILCVSVNDAFVMDAWSKSLGAQGQVRMLGDGNGDFTKAIGLDIDLSANGMGVRSRRYAMLVENGIVKALNLDEPGKFEVSDACTLFGQLD